MTTAPLESSDPDGIEIVKDPGFFRTTADSVLVIPKGAETELCFIVVGPDPVAQFSKTPDAVHFNPGPVQLKATLSDVGHVRIDGTAAADLALNIIGSLITREMITVKELMDNIGLITDKADLSPEEALNGEVGV